MVAKVIADHDITAVVHFAARIVVRTRSPIRLAIIMPTRSRPAPCWRRWLPPACRILIFSSTAAVYGMVGNDPVAEDALLSPICLMADPS